MNFNVKGIIITLSEVQWSAIQSYEGYDLSDGIYESVKVDASVFRDGMQTTCKARAFVLSRSALLDSILNYVPPHPTYLEEIWSNLSACWDLSEQSIDIHRLAGYDHIGSAELVRMDSWQPLAINSVDAKGKDVDVSLAARIYPNPGHVFIATYGTLRRGMHNHHVNAQGGGRFFCTGRTARSYSLYRYRGADFPCLSLCHAAAHVHPIVVDVFEVRRRLTRGLLSRRARARAAV